MIEWRPFLDLFSDQKIVDWEIPEDAWKGKDTINYELMVLHVDTQKNKRFMFLRGWLLPYYAQMAVPSHFNCIKKQHRQ
jgi:hypothetical protein